MTPPDRAPEPLSADGRFLSRNVVIPNNPDGMRFQGEWIAIPREDYDAARDALDVARDSRPVGEGLDVTHLTRAIELAVGDDRFTDEYLRRLAEDIAETYPALVRGLPTADDVRGILSVCGTCGHFRSSHSSGGMCDGGGTECYCVRFPDAPDFALAIDQPASTEAGEDG